MRGVQERAKAKMCTHRESNPGQVLGRHLCYQFGSVVEAWFLTLVEVMDRIYDLGALTFLEFSIKDLGSTRTPPLHGKHRKKRDKKER